MSVYIENSPQEKGFAAINNFVILKIQDVVARPSKL